MFYGQHTKILDDKDRVIVPAEFRQALAKVSPGDGKTDGKGDGKKVGDFFITITPGRDRCLSLFPVEQFTKLFLNFKPHESYADPDVQDYTRLVVGRSHRVACDKQGRVHLPRHLIDDAGLEKELVFVGLFDHAEIWDVVRWGQFNAEKRPTITAVAQKVHDPRRAERSGNRDSADDDAGSDRDG